ncbi:MAG: hypothetical protein R3C19_00640 [Planctomycetaceae bacterium]
MQHEVPVTIRSMLDREFRLTGIGSDSDDIEVVDAGRDELSCEHSLIVRTQVTKTGLVSPGNVVIQVAVDGEDHNLKIPVRYYGVSLR